MYDLLFRSCHDYSVGILAEGKFDDPIAQVYAVSSSSIVPIAFHLDLAYGFMLSKVWKETGVAKYACLY